MSDEELNAYLASGEWKHKAGAYGIQDSGDAFVTIAKGSFSNVVGLPVELVLDMLAEFGIRPNRAGEGARCGT
jgi:septum formation protein